MTLLVLFATSTGAGVVPSHFGSGTDRLGWLGRSCCTSLQLHGLLLAALAAFDFAGFVFGLLRLNQEEVSDGFGVDPVHHVLK